MRYTANRLFHGLLLLAAVSLISFAMANLAPGDYFSALRAESRYSEQTIEGMRTRTGLDRPFPVRYAAWAGSMLRGDFGYSLAYNGPVAPLVRERFGNTLLLTGSATFLAWLLALPLGIWTASARGRWPDRVWKLLLACLLAIPELLLAILLLTFAATTGWFPVGGKHLALPIVVLVAGMLPVLARHVRAAVVELMDAPFAVAARAQGIPRRRWLTRHVLPAAMNPLFSLLGLSLGGLLSASLLVEVVMGWPGLGPLFLDAIMNRDLAIVLAVVMLAAAFLLAGNLIADLLLYRFDPRIRAGKS
jgi:peptide/nickel transport system permease protein